VQPRQLSVGKAKAIEDRPLPSPRKSAGGDAADAMSRLLAMAGSQKRKAPAATLSADDPGDEVELVLSATGISPSNKVAKKVGASMEPSEEEDEDDEQERGRGRGGGR
jgi:hypothetical protein